MAWHVGGCLNTRAKPSWLKMYLRRDLARVAQVAQWSNVNALKGSYVVSSYLTETTTCLHVIPSEKAMKLFFSVDATAMT